MQHTYTIEKYEQLKHIWFTSDTHFGHENIIKYTNRPFKNVNEMDTVLINNWNNVVGEYDTVYHLGDFTLNSVDSAKLYFKQLNGVIHILNNSWHHDKRWINTFNYATGQPEIYESRNEEIVNIIAPLTIINLNINITEKHIKGTKITLCHYPMLEWEIKHHGGLHFHGHTHTQHKLVDNDRINKQLANEPIDVGVDNCNFHPISLYKLLKSVDYIYD